MRSWRIISVWFQYHSQNIVRFRHIYSLLKITILLTVKITINEYIPPAPM